MRISQYEMDSAKIIIVDLVWFIRVYPQGPRKGTLKATRLILSHPHVFRVTRATHFVARRGIEPQTIRLQGERFNHCAIDLAIDQSVRDFNVLFGLAT